MLACIACAKNGRDDGGDETAEHGTTNPVSKDAFKSLTSQLKDMVLKFSGTHRHCKGSSNAFSKSKSLHHHNQRQYRTTNLDKDVAPSDSPGDGQYDYMRVAASSSSTPAWDFSSYATGDRFHYMEEEEEEEEKGSSSYGGKWMMPPDMEDVLELEEGGEPREWTAQVEPGVQVTFVSLPGGAGNDLKRIRFSREIFNKWQAQRWWGENYDRIMELYNVRRFSRQAFPTPSRCDDGEVGLHPGVQREYSRNSSLTGKERVTRNIYGPPPPSGFKRGPYCPPVPDPSQHLLLPQCFAAAGISGVKGDGSSLDASRTTTSSRDDAASISISNASDLDVTEWVEHDEPGVCITLRELSDGTRELRRVRFSRENFGEARAKLWWEQNRGRIQEQYLC